MNQPINEKEKLLMIFSEMNEQLAVMETILSKSFSDLRSDMLRDEKEKLNSSEKRITLLEKNYLKLEEEMNVESSNYSLGKKQSPGLKYELGF